MERQPGVEHVGSSNFQARLVLQQPNFRLLLYSHHLEAADLLSNFQFRASSCERRGAALDLRSAPHLPLHVLQPLYPPQLITLTGQAYTGATHTGKSDRQLTGGARPSSEVRRGASEHAQSLGDTLWVSVELMEVRAGLAPGRRRTRRVRPLRAASAMAFADGRQSRIAWLLAKDQFGVSIGCSKARGDSTSGQLTVPLCLLLLFRSQIGRPSRQLARPSSVTD